MKLARWSSLCAGGWRWLAVQRGAVQRGAYSVVRYSVVRNQLAAMADMMQMLALQSSNNTRALAALERGPVPAAAFRRWLGSAADVILKFAGNPVFGEQA